MEAIGLLTLGLAHDFNNLLTVIVNSLDVIGHRSTDDKTARILETAMRAADRGVLLTRQLLTFGRGQVLAIENVDINALIRNSEELVRRAAADSVELDLALFPGEALAAIDQGQFEARCSTWSSTAGTRCPMGDASRYPDAASQAAPEARRRPPACSSVRRDR